MVEQIRPSSSVSLSSSCDAYSLPRLPRLARASDLSEEPRRSRQGPHSMCQCRHVRQLDDRRQSR